MSRHFNPSHTQKQDSPTSFPWVKFLSLCLWNGLCRPDFAWKQKQYRANCIFATWKGPTRPGIFMWQIQMIKNTPLWHPTGSYLPSNFLPFPTDRERKQDPSWHLLASYLFSFMSDREGYWLLSEGLIEAMDKKKKKKRQWSTRTLQGQTVKKKNPAKLCNTPSRRPSVSG